MAKGCWIHCPKVGNEFLILSLALAWAVNWMNLRVNCSLTQKTPAQGTTTAASRWQEGWEGHWVLSSLCVVGAAPSPTPPHCAMAPAAETGTWIKLGQAGGKLHKLFKTSPQAGYEQLGLLTSSPKRFWNESKPPYMVAEQGGKDSASLAPKPKPMYGWPLIQCIYLTWSLPAWDADGNPQTFQKKTQPSTFLLPGPAARARSSAFTAPKSNNTAKQFLASQKFQSILLILQKICLGNPFWYPWTGQVLIGCYFIPSCAWISASPSQITPFHICSQPRSRSLSV